MIELDVDGADLAGFDVGKKVAKERFLQLDQIGGGAKPGNDLSVYRYRHNPAFRFVSLAGLIGARR